MATEKFKKFWVVSVNNYLCDAAYSGKELKAKHLFPSFRRFTFIRSWDELKYFTKRSEISNEELVKKALNEQLNDIMGESSITKDKESESHLTQALDINNISVGNWVIDSRTNEPQVIIGIEGNLSCIGLDTKRINQALIRTDINMHPKETLWLMFFIGVKLTPEILKELGFYVDNNKAHKIYNEAGNIFKLNIVDGEFFFTWGDRKIEYLHELQNSFLNLTGTKLPLINLHKSYK